MTKREKRLQKLRQNPKDVSLDELRQILESEGFNLDHSAGSHHVFRAKVDNEVIKVVIPFARPIKIVYVKQALAAIDRIIQLKETRPQEDED
ncbi:MAG TPA: type II toxin-antitoxin system HicA family toxin [Aggregatilineales bacterium]|nr:type II toxin-antitoxin system HicA family toxin [Aggregatilineales bacterium]